MGGWGPRNPFAERIEKPVQNIGPPLTTILLYLELNINLNLFRNGLGYSLKGNGQLASCPWEPLTANGMNLLIEIYIMGVFALGLDLGLHHN